MVAKITEVDKLLRSKRLNVTEIRRQVLLLLNEPGKALTHKELEESLEQEMGSIDRVTLYRTIKVLLGKQVIHQITVDAQVVKYKLAGEHKKSNHPHFHCSRCNRLVCMPQVSIDPELLPDGFIIVSSSLIIEGICPQCHPGDSSKNI
jgi:Fur family ferric uptake transcriptional regulator